MLPKAHAGHHANSVPNKSILSSRYDAVAPEHIAIIDDDDDVRYGLEVLLCDAGYEVESFDRADSALLELEKSGAPDAIVFDLVMPGMNGWQFRIEQKKHPKLRDVPVIALSADLSPYAKAVDADAYVPKPVDPDELQAVLARVLLEKERSRLLAKSMELERIHALGTLVASVAHEINNPLTYLNGCLELASRDIEAVRDLGVAGARLAGTLSQNLADAADGAERIASVVRILSTFSRADVNDGKDVDVLRAVQAASRIARHQVTGNASFEEDLAPVPHVVGNEGRLAQVILNLLVNAAQAVKSHAGAHGQVRIATRVEDECVLIEVSDTGPGIEPKLLERIFEPFFTTKPAGEGTGLGLTISRDIVAAMGGTLTVRSALEHGTTFVVTLPVPEHAPRRSEGDGFGTKSSAPDGNTRRVLVIDDEPRIGKLLQLMLSRDLVQFTPSPLEALKLVAAQAYDVILCDFYMPEKTGLEFYREACALRPEVQDGFVLMTGSHSNPQIEEFVRTRQLRLLHKPFSLQALRDCLSCADSDRSRPDQNTREPLGRAPPLDDRDVRVQAEASRD